MTAEQLKDLEDRLWQAADKLRVDSRLKASEYAIPILGLIFLRFASTLGKDGGGCKKTFLNMEGVDRRLHLAFTEILKKTKVVNKSEVENDFKEYIEHVYSIVNLINQDLMT